MPAPTPETPFATLGGESRVRAIVTAFYDFMDAHEPALAKLHPLDENGRVQDEVREKLALFLIGWTGGPQDYVAKFGHPRLRMRHAHVRVDDAQVAAWLRCMAHALDACDVSGDIRGFLDARLRDLAHHMKNG